MLANWRWTFQSPPPKRGACDQAALLLGAARLMPGVSIPYAEAGGVRPTVRVAWNQIKGTAKVSIPSAEAGGVRHRDVRRDAGPPAGRVSIPSAEAGGVRLAKAEEALAAWAKAQVSIPYAEAGGVRQVYLDRKVQAELKAKFQSPPPKRGACDPAEGGAGEHPGRARFQSPPPKRGACDPRRRTSTGARSRSGFNPLRRSGGRATPSPPSPPCSLS